ncbi:NADH-quinone oxidoreductase subunit L [Cryobacterium psychrophilum]|uniref:NADH-quinone oxidoreductase subunit L n=1 Tax=Cryobacterium psychrophilum TaxID=41988 RepID=A0A4Y8KRJ6_9MICO|nr:proton-conducting transporter membrane subunit [Cryobacterium psychrophilum]TDW28896.1 NADH:ubiquinone oxidoreductase subunit 5 (subunit L)/multisubunit Na+/H+ antiporter MnhA subunit [Cryobacterium psychrophilum]TFD81088.1 NADH-quinone oxidoreductase subunit L [Cryobacterium psychrophilum]
MSGLSLALVVLLPAASGISLCLAGPRARAAAIPVSLTTATVTAALSVVVAVTRPALEIPFIAGAPVGLAIDGLSAFVLPFVAIITLLVLIFAAAEGTESPERFHGLMLIFAAAVAMTVTATTLPALLFAWEIMGAMSWALIGFQWRDDRRVQAGLVAFTMTRAGDLGLYLAAGAAVIGGAGLGLADLSAASSPWRDVIAAGLIIAALGKAAQLPFSSWLSRAMQGPSTVSALLHSAAMVAMGGYLLLRVAPLLQTTSWAGLTVAWIGALTALLLGAVAVAQRDLKQLLAASTAAQMGFVVLAAGVGSIAGGAGYLVAHASTKALLFLVAGAWLAALGTKALFALRGAARRWPLVGALFSVGLLSLAGIAPLSLWALKDELLAVALETSPVLYTVGLTAAALSAIYSGKVLFIVWGRADAATEAGYDAEQPGTRHIGRWERIPLIVLAAGAALLGILALPPVSEPLKAMLGETGTAAPGMFELAGSAALALAMLALVAFGLRRGLPQPAWAANWLGLEKAIHLLVVRPTLALSELLARFDDGILDRNLHRLARAGAGGARRLGWFDDARLDATVEATARAGTLAGSRAARADIRGIDGAVEGLARQLGRLGTLARRPQTGRIHQYYAQIAIALAAVFVLILLVR